MLSLASSPRQVSAPIVLCQFTESNCTLLMYTSVFFCNSFEIDIYILCIFFFSLKCTERYIFMEMVLIRFDYLSSLTVTLRALGICLVSCREA